jgi:4-hydroxy-3-methylbut-2-enyl diphosphate reductase IspH
MTQKSDNSHKTEIIVDSKSGFCFGVSRAVQMAEKQLDN